MKICKNKGKTTITDSRQGDRWHLRNGGHRKANARKAGVTKVVKQFPVTSRSKPVPENGGHLRKSPVSVTSGRWHGAAWQPRTPRCRQPEPTQPSNVGGPLTSIPSTPCAPFLRVGGVVRHPRGMSGETCRKTRKRTVSRNKGRRKNRENLHSKKQNQDGIPLPKTKRGDHSY